MPHTTPILRADSATEMIEVAVPDTPTFQEFLATVIADGFRCHTGEQLEPGRTSLVYEPILDGTCPVDMVLPIVAWSTPAREAKCDDIKATIEKALAAGYAEVRPGTEIEVLIYLFGRP